MTRAKAFSALAQAALQNFRESTGLAGNTMGNRDVSPFTETELHQLAVDCIFAALKPVSIHTRRLDRLANSLILTAGYGPYYELTSVSRPLELSGKGSAFSASSKTELWESNATLSLLQRTIDQKSHVSPQLLDRLSQITSYGTIPLIFAERVLGTLSVQCSEDVTASPDRVEFLRSVAIALSSVLGRLRSSSERRTMLQQFRKLDSMMFQDVKRVGTQGNDNHVQHQTNLLRQAIRMAFELTNAAYIFYYRYEQDGHSLVSASISEGTMPSGAELPHNLPASLGVAGAVVTTHKVLRIDDFQQSAIQQAVLDATHAPPQRNFISWVRSIIAAPVLAGDTVEGVIVAVSPIPYWLSADDEMIVGEFAFKIGVCLKALNINKRLKRDLDAMTSLHTIAAAMAGAPNLETLCRLFLLAVTAGECLRFPQAVLLLRQQDDPHTLESVMAVGSATHDETMEQWAKADELPLEAKINECFSPPKPASTNEACGPFPTLRIEYAQDRKLFDDLKNGIYFHRQSRKPHVIDNISIRTLLRTASLDETEYLLIPLRTGSELQGAVFATTAFLQEPLITEEQSEAFQAMAYMLSIALSHQRSSLLYEQIAWGVTYALKTQASLLETRIMKIARAVPSAHKHEVQRLREFSDYFYSAGTHAVNHFNHAYAVERISLLALVRKAANTVDDESIVIAPLGTNPAVEGDKRRLLDALLEILTNAVHFAGARKGTNPRVDVSIEVRDQHAFIHVKDNGEGVHPSIKDNLFKKFHCYPADRMGLGLSYARGLIRAHHGDIRLHDPAGEGAWFTIQLPIAKES